MEEFAFVDTRDGRYRVDVAVDCGMRFEGIAYINDPFTDTPKLHIPKSLGFDAIAKIMEKWNEMISQEAPF